MYLYIVNNIFPAHNQSLFSKQDGVLYIML